MSVYLPRDKVGRPKSRIYQYDFRLTPAGERQSRRFYGSTGQRTRKEALEVEQTLRARAKQGQLTSFMTLAQACWRYYDEVHEGQASRIHQAKNFEHICRLLGGETQLVVISAGLIADAMRRRAGECVAVRRKVDGRLKWVDTPRLVSASSCNRQVLEPLRRLLKRAARVWKVPVNEIDWQGLKRVEPAPIMREARADMEARLWAALRPDYHPIVLFFLMSGLRKSEALLPRSAVDLENRVATIRIKSKRPGKATRLLPLTDDMVALITTEIAKSGSPMVFTYEVQKGPHKGARRPITYAGLTVELRRTFARAGITGFRIHDLRHTFGTRLLRATGNLKLTMDSMGHTDISSTLRYAHVLQDEVRAGMARVNPYRNYPGVARIDAEDNSEKKDGTKG